MGNGSKMLDGFHEVLLTLILKYKNLHFNSSVFLVYYS